MTKSARRLSVKICRLPHAEGLPLPAYQTADAAGMDLLAAIPGDKPLALEPGAHEVIPTGLTFELPPGTEAQVRPRSGLAAKHGVTVLNSPGTIDADYRGEVCVILINFGQLPFSIHRGDRIAQLILAPVTRARLIETRLLDRTARGTGGFGSTGTSISKTALKQDKKQAIAPRRAAAKSISQKTPSRTPRRRSKR